MNPVRQIFKGTLVLASARLIDRASSILLAFFVARIFHAPGLGIYTAAMVTYSLISTTATMGATNLLVREIGKDHSTTNRYFVHLGLLSAALSAVLMALFWVALPYLGYSPDLRSAMQVVILAIIPGTISTFQEGVFVAHQKIEFVTLTTLIASLVNLGLSLYLLMNGYGIVSLLIAYVLVQCVLMLCYLYFQHRYIAPLHWEFDRRFMWGLRNELKTFAALAILAGLFSRPEILVLTLVSTETQLGFYSAALKVISVWLFIPDIYMAVVFPMLSRSYHLADQNAQMIQDKSTKYLLALSFPLTAGIMVAAGPIVHLLYGPGFEPAILALRILALNIPLASLYSILWRVLIARGEQGLVLRAMTIVTFSELAADYFLISALGSLGAAIITPTISLFYVLLLTLYVRRDGTQLHFWQLGWRFGAAALGMGALAWALASQLQLWYLVPLATAVYLVLTLAFRAFSTDDLDLFRQILRVRTTGRSYE